MIRKIKMKAGCDIDITKQKAIEIIEYVVEKKGAGFDDWWADTMDRFGLYDERSDTTPGLNDIFKALEGVNDDKKN